MTASQIIAFRYSDLAADSNLSSYIALATEQVSGCFFGDNTQLAIALWAAHYYYLDTRAGSSQGVAGNIASMKEGDLSLSFGTGSSNGAGGDLGQTAPGRQLLGLISRTQPGAAVTGADIQTLCTGS